MILLEVDDVGEESWEKTRAIRLTRSSGVSSETTLSTSLADRMRVDIGSI